MKDLDHLTRLAAAYLERSRFQPGDLVTWKPGLRNRKLPDYGEPMVVIEVLEEPVYDRTADSGSPYFREPLSVRCLLVDEDGDALVFHFDAARLMPYGLWRSSVAN